MTRDRLTGVVLCVVSAVLLMSALQIRRVIPIGIGPGTFPIILASLLGLMGLVLILRRNVERDAAEDVLIVRTLSGLAIYFALALFTLLAFEAIGFAATGAIIIGLVGRMLGARWPLSVAAACIAPVAIHVVFVRAFSVPLPPGILGGVLP